MRERIAASYGRTSKENDDAFSVAAQLKANRHYANEHDLRLPTEYEFAEDYTGKVLDRPELNQIRKLIRQGAIHILIIYASDRLARKVGVGDLLLDELIEHGVELHIVAWGGAVRDTPEDRVRFNFEMTFSDFERRKIIERTSRGRREQLESGIWHGGPIDKYGFRHVGKKRETRLIFVEEEIAVVRWIFDQFVNRGQGVSAIIRDLQARNIPTRSMAKGIDHNMSYQWGKDNVYEILRDEAYIGVFHVQKFIVQGGKLKRRPKEEWMPLKFPELRVIDDETWQAAQQILDDGRRRYAPDPTNDYLMGRRMSCSCGFATNSFTTTSRGVRYSYYTCSSKTNKIGRRRYIDCNVPNIRADKADAMVWERLIKFLCDPSDQYETLKAAQADLAQKHEEAIANIQVIEQAKLRYERDLTERYDDYRAGLITKAMYIKYKEELDIRLSAAEEAYEEYRQNIEPSLLTDQDIDDAMHDLHELREELAHLGDLPFDKRRALIEGMNITGKMKLEDGWHVLELYVYTRKIDALLLEERVSGRRRRR
jgi:site-specific DNA recombinase